MKLPLLHSLDFTPPVTLLLWLTNCIFFYVYFDHFKFQFAFVDFSIFRFENKERDNPQIVARQIWIPQHEWSFRNPIFEYKQKILCFQLKSNKRVIEILFLYILLLNKLHFFCSTCLVFYFYKEKYFVARKLFSSLSIYINWLYSIYLLALSNLAIMFYMQH